MRARATVAVLAVLTLAAVAPAPAQSTAPGDRSGTVIEISVTQSGDAVWNVSTLFALDSANETRAFRQLGREYVDGEGSVGPSAATFEELAARAADRANRSMRVQDANRTWNVTGYNESSEPVTAVGRLTLTFRWTNFADASGSDLAFGAAFGPAWELGENDRLVVRPPAGYSATTVQPSGYELNNSVLTWTGPQSFDGGEPTVRYVEARDPGTSTDGGPNGTAPPEENTPFAQLGYVAGIVVALLGGGLAVYLWLRRDEFVDGGRGEPDGRATADTDGGTEPGRDTAASAGGNDGSPPAASGSAGEAAAGAGAASGVAAGGGDARDGRERDSGADADGSDGSGGGDEVVDPELLSDEERVERLLEREGGRMKQADIVTETGWSNAKVSQLLSAMDESGRIEKLRIGRENLIRLEDD